MQASEQAAVQESIGGRRERNLTESIDLAKRRYVLQRARYERTAVVTAEALSSILRQQAIPHLLSFRAKHPDNFANKLLLKKRKGEYAQLGEDLNQTVRDLAGVRIIVYDPKNEERVADVIRKNFKLADGPVSDVNFAKPPYPERGNLSGYVATHLIVRAPEGREHSAIEGACCEIQICNVAAHLFNELEHDIKYKLHDAEPTQRTKAALEQLRAGCRDLELAAIAVLKSHQRDIHDQSAELLDAEDFRRALEQLAGRQLRGDFETLFKLVAPLVNRVTVQALLQETGRTVLGLLEAGSQRLYPGHETWSGDDALLLSLGMLDTYSREFSRIATDWEGTRPEIVNVLLNAGESRT